MFLQRSGNLRREFYARLHFYENMLKSIKRLIVWRHCFSITYWTSLYSQKMNFIYESSVDHVLNVDTMEFEIENKGEFSLS